MFQRLKHGQKVTATKYNELVKVIKRLMCISGSNGVKVRYTTAGINISGSRKTQAVSIIKATVIQKPTYPDPAANINSTEYLGFDYYTLRLVNSSYEDWDAVMIYNEDDLVLEDNLLYRALQTSVGVQPNVATGWETFWELQEEIRIKYAIGGYIADDEIERDLRNCVPWFEVGSIVPIIKLNDGSADTYKILQTLQYTGEPNYSSLRYNDNAETQNGNRTMAVFK